MRFYSWNLRYGVATAMAPNMREARKLILAQRVDDYDVDTVKKGKPEVNTNKPVAVNCFQ